MRYKSKKILSLFIGIANEQIPELRQQLCDAEKVAFENAKNKKDEYQPCFYRLTELSEKISEVDNNIEEYNAKICEIDRKITAALADVNLIMSLKSESGNLSCKVSAMNIAKNSLIDDFSIFKAMAYHAYEEYYSAVNEYESAHEIRVTGDFIFTLREIIARSMVECDVKHGDSEVLHAAIYDYTNTITPSDGNYRRVINNMKTSLQQEIANDDDTDSSLGEFLGKHLTDAPSRHYLESLSRMAYEASQRRNHD